MAQRVSRRKLATYAAQQLATGVSSREVLQQIAAYLVSTRRTREQELLVRDIEAALSEKGIVIADIASASPLSAKLSDEIKKVVGASSLQVRATVDPTLLGGVRIDIPGKRFDGTIRRKLSVLKAQQM